MRGCAEEPPPVPAFVVDGWGSGGRGEPRWGPGRWPCIYSEVTTLCSSRWPVPEGAACLSPHPSRTRKGACGETAGQTGSSSGRKGPTWRETPLSDHHPSVSSRKPRLSRQAWTRVWPEPDHRVGGQADVTAVPKLPPTPTHLWVRGKGPYCLGAGVAGGRLLKAEAGPLSGVDHPGSETLNTLNSGQRLCPPTSQ